MPDATPEELVQTALEKSSSTTADGVAITRHRLDHVIDAARFLGAQQAAQRGRAPFRSRKINGNAAE